VWELLAAEDKKKGLTNPIEKFTFRDIRRTCETQLGSIGINKDLRAHVLSHGRSGVRDKHYDKYAYLKEKRRALNKWAKHVKKVIAKKLEQSKSQQPPPPN
jgi:hypothetical protein